MEESIERRTGSLALQLPAILASRRF